MLRYTTTLGIAVLLLVLSADSAIAQKNFYVFGALGNTNSDVALGGLNRVDDGASSYALGAGYSFTRNISLEAAYTDFSSHDGETDCPPGFTCLVIPVSSKANMTGLSLSVIGSFPVTEKLDVYGKLGLTGWDVEFDGISAAFDDSGEDLHYGLGLRWAIDDDWKAFAEFRKADLDLDTFSIGIRYDFGR